MATHRALGPGYCENTYQRDLELRFTGCGLAFVPQKKLEVYDTEHGSELIGYYIPDFYGFWFAVDVLTTHECW
jgi:PD-(D/E)XK nuclease superfamily